MQQRTLHRVHLQRSRRLAGVEMHLHALQQVELADRVLVAGLRCLLGTPQPALDRVEVGESELGIDDVDVGQWIDAAGYVHDLVVHETAHHVRNRVRLADVRQELVAEALTLGRAGDEPGDVHELDRGRNDLLGPGDRRELRKPQVRYRDDAHVRVDRAEGVVRGRGVLGLRHRVEKRRLADVREPDDAALDAHVR